MDEASERHQILQDKTRWRLRRSLGNQDTPPSLWNFFGGNRRSYRADEVFVKLTAWLRVQGVTARKPLHEMRKELGALITQEHGIYAASRTLRHSNVATTAGHYAEKKERTTVPIGSWITPPQKTDQKGNSKKAAPPVKKSKAAGTKQPPKKSAASKS